jgi:hypothetical protein
MNPETTHGQHNNNLMTQKKQGSIEEKTER